MVRLAGLDVTLPLPENAAAARDRDADATVPSAQAAADAPVIRFASRQLSIDELSRQGRRQRLSMRASFDETAPDFSAMCFRDARPGQPDAAHGLRRSSLPAMASDVAGADRDSTLQRLCTEGISASDAGLMTPLLSQHRTWALENLELLRRFKATPGALAMLAAFLDTDQAWTHRHAGELVHNADPAALQQILSLLPQHAAWLSRHSEVLQTLDVVRLAALGVMLNHHMAWTTIHLDQIRQLSEDDLGHLQLMLIAHPEWTMLHFPASAKKPDGYSDDVKNLVSVYPQWAGDNLTALLKLSRMQTVGLLNCLAVDSERTTALLPQLGEIDPDFEVIHALPLLKKCPALLDTHAVKVLRLNRGCDDALANIHEKCPQWLERDLDETDRTARLANALSALLDLGSAHVSEDLPLLIEVDDPVRLDALSQMYAADSRWTSINLRMLLATSPVVLQRMAPLVKNHLAWLSKNVSRLDAADLGFDNGTGLARLMDARPDWVEQQWDVLKKMPSSLLDQLGTEFGQYGEVIVEHLDLIASLNSSARLAKRPVGNFLPLMASHPAYVRSNLPALLKIDGNMHFAVLKTLLDRNPAWVESSCILTEMARVRRPMRQLPDLVQEDEAWMQNNLATVVRLFGTDLRKLSEVMETHGDWIKKHIRDLGSFGSDIRLDTITPLLERHAQWTGAHLARLTSAPPAWLKALPALLDIDPAWVASNLTPLLEFQPETLPLLAGLLERDSGLCGADLEFLCQCTPAQIRGCAIISGLDAWPDRAQRFLVGCHAGNDADERLRPLLETHKHFILNHLGELNGATLDKLLPVLQQYGRAVVSDLLTFSGLDQHEQYFSLAALLEGHGGFVEDKRAVLESFNHHQHTGLTVLLETHPEWVARHLHILARFPKAGQIETLAALLDTDTEWMTGHCARLGGFSADQLSHLPGLLEFDSTLVLAMLGHMEYMKGEGVLADLLSLLQKNRLWTIDHMSDLGALSVTGFQTLADCTLDIRLGPNELLELNSLTPALKNDFQLVMGRHDNWLARNVKKLLFHAGLLDHCVFLSMHSDMDKRQIRDFFIAHSSAEPLSDAELERLVLGQFDTESGHFDRRYNLPVSRRLGMPAGGEPATDDQGLTHASRSTLAPGSEFATALLEAFEEGCLRLPDASYGLEYEMFIRALAGLDEEQLSALRQALELSIYEFKEDISLKVRTNVAYCAEMVTDVMRDVADLRKLQNVLAILNDFGAFSNITSGIHVHIGVKQWNTSHLFDATTLPAGLDDLAEWDARPTRVTGAAVAPTALQLLFMKQLAINMSAMEKTFFQVSRASKHNLPNIEGDAELYVSNVAAAKNLKELVKAVQNDVRNHSVNLHAFDRHGTVEIRGFSKAFGNSMNVDPNMPLRDILLMQAVQEKTLQGMRELIAAGATPQTVPRLRPAEGLDDMMHGYVQDCLLYGTVQAIGMVESARRGKAMRDMRKKRHMMTPATLEKISASRDRLLGHDEPADAMVDYLYRRREWDPAFDLPAARILRTRSPRASVAEIRPTASTGDRPVGMIPALTVTSGATCDEQLLQDFCALVGQGDQVTMDGLPERLRKARSLAFCQIDGEMVAVTGLKMPAIAHKLKLFAMAGVPHLAPRSRYELGWSFTTPSQRGRGLSQQLARSVLEQAPGESSYATVRQDNAAMKHVLAKLGFVAVGRPFLSDKRECNIELYARPKASETASAGS